MARTQGTCFKQRRVYLLFDHLPETRLRILQLQKALKTNTRHIVLRLPSHAGHTTLHHRWLDHSGFWNKILTDEKLVSKGFLWLYTLFNIHVKTCVEQIGKVVQFSDGGATLGDTASGVVDPCLQVAVDLLLLLDFTDRELLFVSRYFKGVGNIPYYIGRPHG